MPSLSSLAVAIGGNATVGTLTHGSAPGITSNLNSTPGFVTAIEPNNNTTGTPQAYLTILFFDERFNFIAAADGGVAQQQVASSWTTSTPALALANIKAPKNGYAYAYISNRSDQSVYFDNLVVGVVAGNIIEEDHYYSFGLKIAAISSRKLGDAGEGKLSNPYLYNDKEMLDEDAGLNWYDYGFRNYDPQIGRFMQLDPLTDDYPELTPYQYASDDPITNIDIDGLEGDGSVGGLSSDFFQGSKSIMQAEVVVTTTFKAIKPAETTAQLARIAKLSLIAIKVAAIVTKVQIATKTLNQGGSTPAVQSQLQKAMDDLVKQHQELSEEDIFRIGVKAKNYLKGLNLMAWWEKRDFMKLDKSEITDGEGEADDLNRVLGVEHAIQDEQDGVFGILGLGANTALFISAAGLFPEVGAGPKGSMLKFRTLPVTPGKAITELEGEVKNNFNRFTKRVPANSRPNATYEMQSDGNYLFRATSPGKVPGSKAVYEKWVNPQGKTFKMTKTTYAPDGHIIHVKSKF